VRRYSDPTGLKLALVMLVVLMAVAGCDPADGIGDVFETVVTPQTWFVATSGNDSNDCLALVTPCRTIGLAIERASAGDMIFVEPGTYQEHNPHGDGAFVIDKNIDLLGDGPTPGEVRLDGAGERPVLVVTGHAHPTVQNLTIQNGGSGDGRGVVLLDNAGLTVYRAAVRDNAGTGIFFTGGAGATLRLDDVEVSRNGNGGVMLGPGTTAIEYSRITDNTGPGITTGGGFLTIRETTVDGNRFDSNGEGLWVGEGSTVQVDNSTFSGHEHVAIFNDGVLTLVNTTVSGNRVGIRNWRDLSLIHSTIAHNSGLSLDDTYARRVSLRSSIVLKAGATDCLAGSGTEVIMEGSNLACWSASDGDLLLGPLADNGGETQTIALLPDSPAIDAAGADCVVVAADQRAVPRPQLLGCDIGAFELRADELGAEPRSLPIAPSTPTDVPTPERITPIAETPPSGLLLKNGNCRRGPGTVFDAVTSLLQGEVVLLEGQNAGEPKWWWVALPQSTAHCWVSAAIVEATILSAEPPIIATPIPPKPTKEQEEVQGCLHQGPNDNQPVCYAPCPANPNPGGACTP
jgi:hypothetical protein